MAVGVRICVLGNIAQTYLTVESSFYYACSSNVFHRQLFKKQWITTTHSRKFWLKEFPARVLAGQLLGFVMSCNISREEGPAVEEKGLMQIDQDSPEYNLNTHWVCPGLYTPALRWLQASPVRGVGLGALSLGLWEKLSLGSASVGSWWQQSLPLRLPKWCLGSIPFFSPRPTPTVVSGGGCCA